MQSKTIKKRFEYGERVICVDDGAEDYLTKGNSYYVSGHIMNSCFGDEFIHVIDDRGASGDGGYYNSDLFEKASNNPSGLPPGITGKVDLSNKPHLAYIDPHMLRECGIGMRHGAKKHGFNNHREMTHEAAQEVLDSILRHINDYLCGLEKDKEQGINNLACVVNNVSFLYRLNRIHGYDNVIDTIYGNTK